MWPSGRSLAAAHALSPAIRPSRSTKFIWRASTPNSRLRSVDPNMGRLQSVSDESRWIAEIVTEIGRKCEKRGLPFALAPFQRETSTQFPRGSGKREDGV